LYLLLLLPCLLYTIFYTGRAIGFDYTPVPIWDTWRSVQYVDQLLRFDLPHFWVQHNEHRIIFPEMIYALDYIFLNGRLILPAAANVLCQFVQIGLLCWLIGRMKRVATGFRLTLCVCSTLFMVSALQVQGILGAFLLQWYLSQTAAAVALLLLWRSARTARLRSLVLSGIAAVAATYSSGNGMLLWPVLVMMAAILRVPKRRVVGLSAAGALSIGTYFIGYHFMTHGRLAILAAHPLYAIWFTGIFAGTPISYVSTTLGGVAGLLSFLLLAAAVLVAIRQRRENEPAFVVTVGVCLFIAATAALTAYGRMEPADAAFNGAKAARYVSVPLTYWANLIVVAAWLATCLARGRKPALHIVAAAVTAILVIVVMRIQGPYERIFAAQQARAHDSGLALENGIEDADTVRVIFPDPPFVHEHVGGIRQRRLSIFADGRQDWLRQPLSRFFITGKPTFCSGSVDTVTMVTGGYHASGWAVDRETDRPPKDIVFADRSGTIIGFGETRPGGYPRENSDNRGIWEWTGFATEGPSGSIQAFALVNKGQAVCPLGPPREVPHSIRIDARLAGAVIPIAWKADPAWTRNGFHPSVGTLSGEALYGSYSGSDANQGSQVTAPFETAGHACIAFPVAHGPSVDGQSVRIIDAGTGKTLDSIPLRDSPGAWQFWAVEFQGSPRLQIVAEDKGSQWGQWVGIGEPHWCK
jgi:hypothetical protein